MALTLNDGQKLQVLTALLQLPHLATVKQIREKTGLEDLTAPALRPMVSAGLIVETQVKEAPSVRFDLAPAGRQLAVAHQAGHTVTVPEPARPADGSLTRSAGDVREALRSRFDAGEGDTALSRRKLADEFGVTLSVVSGVKTQWLRKRENTPEQTPPEPTAPGQQSNQSPAVAPARAHIAPDDLVRLHARFAAGEGQTVESRRALGVEFGLLTTTVAYHLGRWEKAGRPNPEALDEPREPADLPTAPGAAPAPDPAEPGKAPDGDQAAAESQCSVPTPLSPETEHPVDHDGQGSQGVTFDSAAGTPETEHPAPPETATEPEAPSTNPAASSTENAGPSTSAAVPDTAMAQALAKAGILPAGTGKLPDKPGRRLKCQVCHQPVDTIVWYTDTKTGLSGHKGCVQPAAALQGEERVPVVGQICEGTVFTVDAGGMYALIELTEFTDHRRMHPYLRGKVTRAQVLRRGWCEDVRDWLQDGDLVNVKVLDIQADSHKGRYRINLSIKQAPAHQHERIPLEVSEPAPPGEPIVARGAEVAAALAEEPVSNVGKGAAQVSIISAILESDGTIRDVKVLTSTPTAAQLPAIVDDLAQHQPGPDETERTQAAIAAADLCRQHHLDPRHVDDLTERILEAGVPQVTAELEADLKTMAELKTTSSAARTAALDQAATALSSENVDPDHIAERVAPQLHDQLLAAQLEIEQLRAALSAKRAEASRMVRGLCPSCVHGIDGFCPYADMVAETYDLPEEDRPERHRGRRIVFGRRPVIDCDLYRGDCTAAD